jgi:hypothetical protein
MMKEGVQQDLGAERDNREKQIVVEINQSTGLITY